MVSTLMAFYKQAKSSCLIDPPERLGIVDLATDLETGPGLHAVVGRTHGALISQHGRHLAIGERHV